MNIHNPVQIAYVDLRGEESRRVVEPHQIVFKNGAPYVYGWCRKRQAFRLFKLSRILDLQAIDETFDFREMPAAELDGTPYAQELQETISLRIRRSLAERVLDYCPYERFTPDGDDHYLVSFPFIDSDYYYDLLLFFGEDCEVLGRLQFERRWRASLIGSRDDIPKRLARLTSERPFTMIW